MNLEQTIAYNSVIKGDSLFIGGSAGCGKSYVIRHLADHFNMLSKPYQLVAPNGVAAVNIGGVTIHSFFMLMPTTTTLELWRKRMGKKGPQVSGGASIEPRIIALKKLSVLIIEEVSTLGAPLLTLMHEILQFVRGDERPFGGVQVVFFGDFYQIAPIRADYAFEADVWKELAPRMVELTRIIRQTDPHFAKQLCKLRLGIVDTDVVTLLRELSAPFEERLERDPECAVLLEHPVVLEALNVDKDKLNEMKHLAQTGEVAVFQAIYDGDVSLLRGCLAPDTLRLKINEPVIHLVNAADLGLYNGSLGVVVNLSPLRVKFIDVNGKPFERDIKMHKWKIDGPCSSSFSRPLASKTQIPLTLAYCFSINKAQGMSLDSVKVNLKGVFAPGMSYVALSRARSVRGLQIEGIRGKSLSAVRDIFRPDARVVRFMQQQQQNEKDNIRKNKSDKENI